MTRPAAPSRRQTPATHARAKAGCRCECRCRRPQPPARRRPSFGGLPQWLSAARGVARHVDNQQVAFDRPLATILEGDLGRDVAALGAVVEGVNQRTISVGYSCPANLERARELAIVSIEFLVQDKKAADL